MTTALLQITFELLHHYFNITTLLLHITGSLLRHYNSITTYYYITLLLITYFGVTITTHYSGT
jgi:hypothetical protein